MDPDLFLPLTVLGGFLALDGTALGQFMISRPVAAGILSGWVVGDPRLGLLMGSILELYLIPIFPVGGARFPEGGPSTVVAVAAAWAFPGPGGLALGTALGLVWSQWGARSVRYFRQLNGSLVVAPGERPAGPGRVVMGHMLALVLEFGRGAALTLLGLALAGILAGMLRGLWELSMPATLALLALGISVPGGVLVVSLGGWQRRGALFLAGFASFLLGGLLL